MPMAMMEKRESGETVPVLRREMSKRVRVSVIVPTFNSARTLGRCLESIRDQIYGDVETIIVDRHSEDETVKVAEKYSATVLLRGPERSSQKNWGAANAGGNLLYFVDSDFVLERDAIAKCVDLCRHYDGVTTVNYSVGKSIWGRSIALKERFLAHDPTIQTVRFVRKDAFVQIGGFDEKLVIGEDLDLYRRLLDGGFRIGKSDAVEWHVGEPETLREVTRRSYYYGKVVRTYFVKRKSYAVSQLSPFKPSLTWNLVRTGSPYLLSLVVVDATRWLASLFGLACASLN